MSRANEFLPEYSPRRATRDIASEQADRLLPITRRVLDADRKPGEFFSGTSACLSALYKAERFEELVLVAGGEHIFWHYKSWAVRALAALGRRTEALRLAESSRGPWSSDFEIDQLSEEILLSSGLVEEAYQRYGLSANRAGTYLATFRAVAKRYPSKAKEDILEDLVETTPGEEGKWFAAAKSVGLFAEALSLARRSPCDPRTLTRAARDFATKQLHFAANAGLLALHWIDAGFGYEITAADVWAAYDATKAAGRQLGDEETVVEQIRRLAGATEGSFTARVLARELASS